MTDKTAPWIYLYTPTGNCHYRYLWSEVFAAIAMVPDCYTIRIRASVGGTVQILVD